MNRPAIILGLLTDQHGGDHGLRLPFLGHDCSTTRRRRFSPCVTIANFTPPFATASGWRNGGSNWAKKFPRTKTASRVRSQDIMRDVNRAFETAVRRDPANWFWVHHRWKPAPKKSRVESRKSKARRTYHEFPRSARLQTARSAPRILVRGTNWLGDAVMTTPALLRLREKFPDAHIALLTPEKLRGSVGWIIRR